MARPHTQSREAAMALASAAAAEDSQGSAKASVDGDLIRRRWRSLVGRHPPKSLTHAMMDRILAWREQVVEAGDVSPHSRAILAAALAGKAAAVANGDEANNAEDIGGRDAPRPHAPMRAGTTLFREHAGVLHRVEVVAEGFEWEGRIYASLSAVARAITGVRWNGRRFFALDRGAKQPGARKASKRAAGARSDPRVPNETVRVGAGDAS